VHIRDVAPFFRLVNPDRASYGTQLQNVFQARGA